MTIRSGRFLEVFLIGLLISTTTGGATTDNRPPWKGTQANLPEDQVASINTEALFLFDLEELLEGLHMATTGEAPRGDFNLDRLLKRLINDTLIAQEAAGIGIGDDPALQARIEDRRLDLLSSEITRRIRETEEPTESEIETAYALLYQRARVRSFKVADRQGGVQAFERLQAGESFAEVARSISEEVAEQASEVSEITRVQFKTDIADQIFALEPGDVAGPIQIEEGWTLVYLDEALEAESEMPEESRAYVERFLLQDRLEQAKLETLAAARKGFPVEIQQEVFKAIRAERLPDGRLTPTIPDPTATVALIGAESRITAKEFGEVLLRRWTGVKSEDAANAASPLVLNSLIESRLLALEAAKRGYDLTPSVQGPLRRFERDLLVETFLKTVLAPSLDITDDEARDHYETIREEAKRPTRLLLGQITVSEQAVAEDIVQQLEGGADFGWAAKKYSEDRFRDQGGKAGWRVPAPNVDEFNNLLLQADEGAILGPFGNPPFVVVYKVLVEEDQGIYTFEEIEENVRTAVLMRRLYEKLDEVFTQLYALSEILVDDDALTRVVVSGERDLTDKPESRAHYE